MRITSVRRHARRATEGALLLLCAGALALPTEAGAATTTKSYTTAGTYSFTVPAGVTGITVTAIGAAGGAANCSAAKPNPSDVPGGRGASVTATVDVTPGSQLFVGVGGVGGAASTCSLMGPPPTGAPGAKGGQGGGADGGRGTFFAGAGGGGASGVGSTSLAAGTAPLVVAGGGGGASYGAKGGDAGSPGTTTAVICPPSPPGGAGTQTAGGKGGAAGSPNATAGGDGQSGAGGAGGNGDSTAPSTGGGGGGGGYWGGGGGGGGGPCGGSGGGGSSFTEPDAAGVSGPTLTNSGASVTITYTPSLRPKAVTGGVGPVGADRAKLHGQIDTQGQVATYYFQYGTHGYTHTSATRTLPAGSVAWVGIQLKGLQPGTKYRYRLVAMNPTGTTRGAGKTFTTASPASINLPPPTVAPGSTLHLAGRAPSCKAGSTITLHSRAFTHQRTIATVQHNHHFSATAHIPPNQRDGTYEITASCQGRTLSIHAHVRVQARSTSRPPTSPNRGFTG